MKAIYNSQLAAVAAVVVAVAVVVVVVNFRNSHARQIPATAKHLYIYYDIRNIYYVYVENTHRYYFCVNSVCAVHVHISLITHVS